MSSRRIVFLMLMVMLAVVVGCRPDPQPTPTPTATPAGIPTDAAPVDSGPTPLPTEGPSPTPPGPFGPTGFPPNVNPLTGTLVDDPAILDHRPLLIKVSNQSPDVRPQSGLSMSDHVWEYQMEGYGLTRYTAVVYGQNPEFVGSVRSARLIDLEHLTDMYSAILVNSGASTNRQAGGPPRVNELLRAAPFFNRVMSEDFGYSDPYLVRKPGIPREGVAGYHTLFAVPSEIWKWGAEKGFGDKPNLDGMFFDINVPAGGTPTTEAAIDYPGRGPRHVWRFDASRGEWLSLTEDQLQVEPTPIEDVDYLTNEPLYFDNIVVLYAFHYDADYIEDEPNQLPGVHSDLSGEGDAILLRDGQRFEITWKRVATDGILQFFDASGSPIAFRPGNTWFNVYAYNISVPDVTFLP